MSLQEQNLVSRKTAQELQRLILRNPGTAYPPHPARGGARGRMPVIVKCLDSTAIGGGGIGDEAYDAVMIAAHGDEASGDQPELTPVWLTVLGNDVTPEVPAEGGLYHGIFAGDFDPGSDPRPRVFATGTPTGGTSAGSCGGGCGTFVGVPDDAAFTLEVDCNAGEFDHATFAADFDGVPLSAAQFRSTAAKTWTLQYWDVTTEAWLDWEFNTSGALNGLVTLTPFTTAGPSDGAPQLTIEANTLLTRCVGSDYTFTGGRMNGFNGAGTAPSGANACLPNDFTLRVSCTCLWPDGWTGPGYYPTADEDCEAECVAALIDDPCTFTGLICGPRFDTLEEAEFWCDPTAPCQSYDFTGAVVSITMKTGDCSCLPDSPAISGTATLDELTVLTPGCSNEQFDLFCDTGFYSFFGFVDEWTLVSFTAGPPVVIVIDILAASFYCGAGAGTARVTITGVT